MMRCFAIAVGLSLAACGDALVGGHCAEGHYFVPGVGCEAADAASTGADGTSADVAPGPTDAITPDSFARDVATQSGDAGNDGGPIGDDGVVCGASRVDCGGVCVDVNADPANCGACGHACGAGEVCARGSCSLTCPPPTVDCAGSCVDLDTDPNNCGACGNVCRTGLCNAGLCREARAGHLVVIGHGFESSRADQDRIVANAVFLSPSSPARVLSYQQYADTSQGGDASRIDAAIDRGANHRPWNETAIDDADTIPHMLSIDRFDVMLIDPQVRATDAQIASAAAAMGDALASFARAGGVVLIVDGTDTNGGNAPFANATGLLTPGAAHDIDGDTVTLLSPLDALAAGVSTAYRAEPSSVAYDGDLRHAVFAVGDAPVVLHVAVLP